MFAVFTAALAMGTAASAHADPDTDFSNSLHADGIYGPKDQTAWIAKIACERIDRGVDANAPASAAFVYAQLNKGSTTQQAWQFLTRAIATYCPENQATIASAAEPAQDATQPQPSQRGSS